MLFVLVVLPQVCRRAFGFAVGSIVTILRNVWRHEDGVSAHSERNAQEFAARHIAPGTMVWFRPSFVKYKLSKTMPKLQPGIFLGYEVAQGCR